MFINYLKTGIRNILRNKAFSFIKVFGLALGMSVCMLIMLMLADHKSYDQFHGNRERIYRILSDRDNSKAPSATTPFSLAENLRNYPIVEETTQLTRGVRPSWWKKQDDKNFIHRPVCNVPVFYHYLHPAS